MTETIINNNLHFLSSRVFKQVDQSLVLVFHSDIEHTKCETEKTESLTKTFKTPNDTFTVTVTYMKGRGE